MPTSSLIEGYSIGGLLMGGGGGIAIIGLILRSILTWMGRQGMIATADSSQKEIYERLSAEAKKWESRYNEAISQHNDYVELIQQLRTQNAMMRLMLIHNGVLAEEIDAMVAEANKTQSYKYEKSSE